MALQIDFLLRAWEELSFDQLKEILSQLTSEEKDLAILVSSNWRLGWSHLNYNERNQGKVYDSLIIKTLPYVKDIYSLATFGEYLSRMDCFEVYYSASQYFDVAWAVIKNENTPEHIALDLLTKVRQAYETGKLTVEPVVAVMDNCWSRFCSQIIEWFLDDEFLVKEFFSNGNYRKHCDAPVEFVQKIYSCHRLSVWQFLTGFKNATEEILRFCFQKDLELGQQRQIARILSHKNCSESLLREIWEKDLRRTHSHFEEYLKSPVIPWDIGLEILEQDTNRLRSHKKRFEEILGKDVVDGVLAARKLLK